MNRPPQALRGIKDIFYESRVLSGRDFTLRRFAREVLGGSVDPVMLGYIESGKRFPSESLVRRLAAARGLDADELLAVLARDRMLRAFGRELRRALGAPHGLEAIADAELAVLLSRAIAALPDDGAWRPVASWRSAFRVAPRRGRRAAADKALLDRVVGTLRERGLIEVRAGKVRRRGRHFVARDLEERQALAIEFCALFTKGLLDKLALPDKPTGTYLRNHFLNVDPARLPEFHERLEEALRGLAEEFASDPSTKSRFLNVLVTATML